MKQPKIPLLRRVPQQRLPVLEHIQLTAPIPHAKLQFAVHNAAVQSHRPHANDHRANGVGAERRGQRSESVAGTDSRHRTTGRHRESSVWADVAAAAVHGQKMSHILISMIVSSQSKMTHIELLGF